jgi:demethylmenaquinone methyltransferase/2-methoxy-6-polyprenyl-1,4-benzoquinol methylase
MLSQAAFYHNRYPELNPAFVLGNAAHMPFDDHSFDLVSISMALHEKEPALQDAIVKEMRRVVKKNGALVIADYRQPLPANPSALAVRLAERLAGGEHHANFRHYMKNGGLCALLNGITCKTR